MGNSVYILSKRCLYARSRCIDLASDDYKLCANQYTLQGSVTIRLFSVLLKMGPAGNFAVGGDAVRGPNYHVPFCPPVIRNVEDRSFHLSVRDVHRVLITSRGGVVCLCLRRRQRK